MSEPSPEGGKTVTVSSYGDTFDVVLVQTEEGRPEQYRGHNSNRYVTVTVDRAWDVFFEGEYVGSVQYSMLTRERRSGQRTYVNSRWHSPGWTSTYPRHDGSRSYLRGAESPSRSYAIVRLVLDAKRRARESQS